jgi:CRP-like cAMP-binding protein
MTAPAYFGEIGVIEGIPRTATVRTMSPSRLLRIEADDFLDALSDSTPSPSLVDGMSGRLARTHPSYRATAGFIAKAPDAGDQTSVS